MGGWNSLHDDLSGRRKQYVEVVAEHKLDGMTSPVTVILSDGRRYDVELARDPFSSEESEGVLTVYPIRARTGEDGATNADAPTHSAGEGTYLFECAHRWYVLMKT